MHTAIWSFRTCPTLRKRQCAGLCCRLVSVPTLIAPLHTTPMNCERRTNSTRRQCAVSADTALADWELHADMHTPNPSCGPIRTPALPVQRLGAPAQRARKEIHSDWAAPIVSARWALCSNRRHRLDCLSVPGGMSSPMTRMSSLLENGRECRRCQQLCPSRSRRRSSRCQRQCSMQRSLLRGCTTRQLPRLLLILGQLNRTLCLTTSARTSWGHCLAGKGCTPCQLRLVKA
mmetsp:Transcript_29358/g.68359  ORF Transcript_29358/g.68359 Transcript_29358/m.68359 type:complete len:232 (-) Transcript_29358:267-962(-)